MLYFANPFRHDSLLAFLWHYCQELFFRARFSALLTPKRPRSARIILNGSPEEQDLCTVYILRIKDKGLLRKRALFGPVFLWITSKHPPSALRKSACECQGRTKHDRTLGSTFCHASKDVSEGRNAKVMPPRPNTRNTRAYTEILQLIYFLTIDN